MVQDWLDKLYSDDPKIRAKAVKAIALSGNKDYLNYLVEIAEKDPDSHLRDYAKKAAQHLYTSQAKTEPTPDPTPTFIPDPDPEPDPEPVSQPPAAREKTESEIAAALANPMPGKEEDDLTSSEVREAATKVQRAFTLHSSGNTKKALQVYAQALVLNPFLDKDTYARSVAAEITGQQSPEIALHTLKDPEKVQDMIEELKNKGKKDKKGNKQSSPTSKGRKRPVMDRSKSGLIQTWLSFFAMTEDLFLAEEEKANTEDTLLSVLVYTIATVVISMVTGFVQFQQITTIMGEQLPQLGFNLGTIFFFILIGTVIMSPISFYMTTGLQFLGARIFGGSGEFKSHAYMMALILVPATVLGGMVSLLAFIPFIGFLAGLAGFGISIFTIILNVRAIKSIHNMTTGLAIASIIVPPIVLSAIVGCLLMTVGSSLLAGLSQLQ